MSVSDVSDEANYIDTSDQEERDELIVDLQWSERSPSKDQWHTPRKRRKLSHNISTSSPITVVSIATSTSFEKQTIVNNAIESPNKGFTIPPSSSIDATVCSSSPGLGDLDVTARDNNYIETFHTDIEDDLGGYIEVDHDLTSNAKKGTLQNNNCNSLQELASSPDPINFTFRAENLDSSHDLDGILSLPGSPSPFTSAHFPRASSLPIHISFRSAANSSTNLQTHIIQNDEDFDVSQHSKNSFNNLPIEINTMPKSFVLNDPIGTLHSSSPKLNMSSTPGVSPKSTDPRYPSVAPHLMITSFAPIIDHSGSLLTEGLDDTDVPRRYSLRTRQARQLKPYEYDKMMYRLQLKDNPDAIVKVVSPSKDGNRHRSHENYGHGDNFNEFSEKECEDNHVKERRSPPRHPRHRRASSHTSRIPAEADREKWYPEDLRLSDDDDLPLPTIDNAFRRNSGDTFTQKHKTKPRKTFASTIDSVLPLPKNGTTSHEQHPVDQLPTLSPRGYSSTPRRSIDIFNNYSAADDIPSEGFYHDDEYDYNENLPEIGSRMRDLSISPLKSSNVQDQVDIISIASDEDLESLDNHQEMSNSDDEEQQGEKIKKQRRALKALGRMMPAFMVSKVLKQRSDTSQPDRHSLSPNRFEEKDTVDIGHSRARKMVQGDNRLANELRGDTESSDTDFDTRNSSAPEGSSSDEDEALEDDVIEAYWFDNDVGIHYQDDILPREDLIDRMLSRTGNGGQGKKRHGVDPGRLASGERRAGCRKLSRNFRNNTRRTYDGQQTVLSFSGKTLTDKVANKGYGNLIDLSLSPGQRNFRSKEKAPNLNTEKKRKSLRKELRMKQTYLFPSDGKRISSGLRRNVISIDVDDEEFHEALAPIHRDGSKAKPTAKKAIARSTDREHLDTDRGEIEELPYAADRPPKKSIHSELDIIPENAAKLTVDMDIPTLPSGLAFGQDTYLGKQYLHELLLAVSGEINIGPPSAYINFGLHLHTNMNISDYSSVFAKVVDLLCSWTETMPQPSNDEQIETYRTLMQVTCHYSTYLAINTNDPDLINSTLESLQRLMQMTQTSLSSSSDFTFDSRLLETLWFMVELTSQMVGVSKKLRSPVKSQEAQKCILLLCKYLSKQHINNNVSAWIQECTGKLSINTVSGRHRAAELWICLIYLAPKVYDSQNRDHSIWTLVLCMVDEVFSKFMSDFEASEHAWRLIFNLCALSQFSCHGISTSAGKLPPSWDLVTRILKVIRLTSDPAIDKKLSTLSLRKRDDYVRLVVARCYLLNSRWQWILTDAYSMFNRLVEIFKSRKFMNLRGEVSDFPTFLRQSDLSLLKEIKRADSAFSLFLKMIVGAVKVDEGLETGLRASANLRKLLSLAVPLSGVTFSKSSPPTNEELSMLYNRFSSLIIAIFLEPTESNLRNRLSFARRYADFPQADLKSRQASIRALMHAAILTRHLRLPLAEPLQWLKDMTDTLLEEYREVDKGNSMQSKFSRSSEKNEIVLCIQLLLGCVRVIIETPSMDSSLEREHLYPDPALLNGPWVGRIFATKDLTSVVTTSLEIRKLVQSFLHARSFVVPPPRRPHLVSMNNTESQESQDEFGNFDLDLNDPELISALENAETGDNADNTKTKDNEVAKIMDESISPAIYRFITKHFSDPRINISIAQNAERYSQDAGDWIDCWVDCAAIIVRIGRRDWSHYLSLGPQSWERISDSISRRRVGLRFMFRVLQSDPSAYVIYQDNFLELLLDSLVTAEVTLEHEYISLVLSIDGMRHQMLRDLKVQRLDESQDVQLSRVDFFSTRVDLINSIFAALNTLLDRATHGQTDLEYQNQKWVGFILIMLSTMRDIFDNVSGRKDKQVYLEFCREIYASLSHHTLLQTQSRLSKHVAWGAALEMTL